MHEQVSSRPRLPGRRAALAALAGLAGLALGPQALANLPRGPLRILCTGPGGSIPDLVARHYAEKLAARHPAGVLVDNRPGAAGRIAIGALTQAVADGSTWLLAQGAVAAVYPFLYDKLPYDAGADLRPLSTAAEATLGLAVGPGVPSQITTPGELIEWMRSNPKRADIASPGAGTLPHLMAALLAHEAKLSWQHVPYQGGPAALVDLMAGRVSALVLPEGLLRPYALAGRLRVLATSGEAPSVFLPDVPTLAQQGYPSLVMREWFAFFMPGATSPAAAQEAAQSVGEVAANQTLQAALAEIGMVAVASTPAELGQRIALEQRYWQRVLRDTGIKAQ